MPSLAFKSLTLESERLTEVLIETAVQREIARRTSDQPELSNSTRRLGEGVLSPSSSIPLKSRLNIVEDIHNNSDLLGATSHATQRRSGDARYITGTPTAHRHQETYFYDRQAIDGTPLDRSERIAATWGSSSLSRVNQDPNRSNLDSDIYEGRSGHYDTPNKPLRSRFDEVYGRDSHHQVPQKPFSPSPISRPRRVSYLETQSPQDPYQNVQPNYGVSVPGYGSPAPYLQASYPVGNYVLPSEPMVGVTPYGSNEVPVNGAIYQHGAVDVSKYSPMDAQTMGEEGNTTGQVPHPNPNASGVQGTSANALTNAVVLLADALATERLKVLSANASSSSKQQRAVSTKDVHNEHRRRGSSRSPRTVNGHHRHHRSRSPRASTTLPSDREDASRHRHRHRSSRHGRRTSRRRRSRSVSATSHMSSTTSSSTISAASVITDASHTSQVTNNTSTSDASRRRHRRGHHRHGGRKDTHKVRHRSSSGRHVGAISGEEEARERRHRRRHHRRERETLENETRTSHRSSRRVSKHLEDTPEVSGSERRESRRSTSRAVESAHTSDSEELSYGDQLGDLTTDEVVSLTQSASSSSAAAPNIGAAMGLLSGLGSQVNTSTVRSDNVNLYPSNPIQSVLEHIDARWQELTQQQQPQAQQPAAPIPAHPPQVPQQYQQPQPLQQQQMYPGSPALHHAQRFSSAALASAPAAPFATPQAAVSQEYPEPDASSGPLTVNALHPHAHQLQPQPFGPYGYSGRHPVGHSQSPGPHRPEKTTISVSAAPTYVEYIDRQRQLETEELQRQEAAQSLVFVSGSRKPMSAYAPTPNNSFVQSYASSHAHNRTPMRVSGTPFSPFRESAMQHTQKLPYERLVQQFSASNTIPLRDNQNPLAEFEFISDEYVHFDGPVHRYRSVPSNVYPRSPTDSQLPYPQGHANQHVNHHIQSPPHSRSNETPRGGNDPNRHSPIRLSVIDLPKFESGKLQNTSSAVAPFAISKSSSAVSVSSVSQETKPSTSSTHHAPSPLASPNTPQLTPFPSTTGEASTIVTMNELKSPAKNGSAADEEAVIAREVERILRLEREETEKKQEAVRLQRIQAEVAKRVESERQKLQEGNSIEAAAPTAATTSAPIPATPDRVFPHPPTVPYPQTPATLASAASVASIGSANAPLDAFPVTESTDCTEKPVLIHAGSAEPAQTPALRTPQSIPTVQTPFSQQQQQLHKREEYKPGPALLQTMTRPGQSLESSFIAGTTVLETPRIVLSKQLSAQANNRPLDSLLLPEGYAPYTDYATAVIEPPAPSAPAAYVPSAPGSLDSAVASHPIHTEATTSTTRATFTTKPISSPWVDTVVSMRESVLAGEDPAVKEYLARQEEERIRVQIEKEAQLRRERIEQDRLDAATAARVALDTGEEMLSPSARELAKAERRLERKRKKEARRAQKLRDFAKKISLSNSSLITVGGDDDGSLLSPEPASLHSQMDSHPMSSYTPSPHSSHDVKDAPEAAPVVQFGRDPRDPRGRSGTLASYPGTLNYSVEMDQEPPDADALSHHAPSRGTFHPYQHLQQDLGHPDSLLPASSYPSSRFSGREGFITASRTRSPSPHDNGHTHDHRGDYRIDNDAKQSATESDYATSESPIPQVAPSPPLEGEEEWVPTSEQISVMETLIDGQVFLKHGRWGSPKRRLLWLDLTRETLSMCWGDPTKGLDINSAVSVSLGNITQAVAGCTTSVLKKHRNTERENLVFSLLFSDTEAKGKGSLDLECDTSEERDLWVRVLNAFFTEIDLLQDVLIYVMNQRKKDGFQ